MRIGRQALAVLALAVLAGCGGPGGSHVPAPRPTPAPGAGPRPAPVSRPPALGLIDAALDGGTARSAARAGDDYAQCEAELAAARVTFTPQPDRVNSETCGIAQAGLLGPDMGTVARMAPAGPVMTCRLALAISIWRRQSVEPAAREILGSDVVQIDHMGTYACRSVSNRPGARPSAHSRAAALDFGGVRLRDGRRITVAADWRGDGPEARFLRRIRDDGCKIFGMVLSPDYDAAHQDHLHLEPGQSYCR